MATHAHFIQGKINLYKRWTEGVPAGAPYRISESGWMDTSVFLLKFTRLFLRAVAHLTKTATVLLLLDVHHPHISLDLIRTACDSNVILLCLPPNTTHPLQPLDAGVFGPLKTTWRSILKKYKLEAKGSPKKSSLALWHHNGLSLSCLATAKECFAELDFSLSPEACPR